MLPDGEYRRSARRRIKAIAPNGCVRRPRYATVKRDAARHHGSARETAG